VIVAVALAALGTLSGLDHRGARAAPASVYEDYVTDKALSCKHTRADLEATLNDAAISQYGDPYTLAGLKAAIRKQLAGSCGRLPAG